MRKRPAGLILCLLVSVAGMETAAVPEGNWLGQLVMVGFRGLALTRRDPFLTQVRELNLGGVVLFDRDVPSGSDLRNIESRQQVEALTARLQEAAATPLLIAVDQEGGRIARLKEGRGFPATLSHAELGRLDSERETRQQAERVARLLRELGINTNFAPVLDLATNPDNPIIAGLERSYGGDPALVGRHARWTIQEFHRQGILAAVKHFPGHGSSRQDSHLGLPDVTSVWSRRELEPYAALIREGLPDLVMTAHLFNRHWDQSLPATLSPALTRMLREELGFDGVIVSDDLQMGAIVQQHSFEQAIELALKAGVDLLVFSNNGSSYDPDIAPRALSVIRDLLSSGRIKEERLRRSWERIMRLKQRLP